MTLQKALKLMDEMEAYIRAHVTEEELRRYNSRDHSVEFSIRGGRPDPPEFKLKSDPVLVKKWHNLFALLRNDELLNEAVERMVRNVARKIQDDLISCVSKSRAMRGLLEDVSIMEQQIEEKRIEGVTRVYGLKYLYTLRYTANQIHENSAAEARLMAELKDILDRIKALETE